MTRTTEFLLSFRRIFKLYDRMLKPVCEAYHLTLIEANIVSFLHNNPGHDTARDIVELRMMSKGNVSQAVESLIQKGLLKRSADKADRRIVHLTLTPEAEPVTSTIKEQVSSFQEELFTGFSSEERERYHQLSKRMMENTKSAMKRRETL